MTPKWLHILQHTLGLDQYGQPPEGRRPCADDDYPNCYRNNYVIGAEAPDFYLLRELVEAGLMMDAGPKKMLGGMHVFHATRAGFEAVKKHSSPPPKVSKAKRRWRHFCDVREVCPGLSFGDYLRAPWRAESEARAGV